ncbi:hypothetical protein [Jatrophihabitans sp.]|uniref:hypothetical protein n=1 Tax=Jatrophihabitans sp. TaxID=1932789 RepID=UPI0030C72680|nr:hypothetical protein [Jatrophihabitans sp.]
MSPSEFQLRAALRDGEGDGVDPDRIISSALRLQLRRHDRRVRVLAVAAVIVVISGGAVGIAALNGSTRESGGAASAQSRTAAAGAAAGGADSGGAIPKASSPSSESVGASGGAVVPSSPLPGVTCPKTPVSYELPGGGGTNQFGADGPLFAEPVAAIAVCSYPLGAASPTPLTGTAATALARKLELEGSSSPRSGPYCAGQVRGELLSFTSDGTQLRPVEITGTCTRVELTNGSAVRYVSLDLFTQAGVKFIPAGLTPGKVSGSPKR